MWAVFLAIASCHDSRCAMFEPRDVVLKLCGRAT